MGERRIRPWTKFNDAIAERIVLLIKSGTSIGSAALVAGIHPATFYRWMEMGERRGKRYAAFHAFRERVTAARAEMEAQLVAIVRTAASTDPKHAEWLLERRFPQDFGRSTRVEGTVAVPLSGKVEVKREPLDQVFGNDARVASAMAHLLTAIAEAGGTVNGAADTGDDV